MYRLVIFALCLAPSLTFAWEQQQTQKQGQHQKQSQHQSQTATASADSNASATASNAGNIQTIDASAPAHVHVSNVPDVALGGLYPSAVCMGVRNAGVGVQGLGIGAGSSYRDEECDIREAARSWAALGYRDEAVRILCSLHASHVLATCPLIHDAPVAPPVAVVVTPTPAVLQKVEEQKRQVSGNK